VISMSLDMIDLMNCRSPTRRKSWQILQNTAWEDLRVVQPRARLKACNCCTELSYSRTGRGREPASQRREAHPDLSPQRDSEIPQPVNPSRLDHETPNAEQHA
jgi:hypothetical protein